MFRLIMKNHPITILSDNKQHIDPPILIIVNWFLFWTQTTNIIRIYVFSACVKISVFIKRFNFLLIMKMNVLFKRMHELQIATYYTTGPFNWLGKCPLKPSHIKLNQLERLIFFLMPYNEMKAKIKIYPSWKKKYTKSALLF